MAQGPGEVEQGAVRTTDDIRSQIEQTRAEMSDTIDAIQTRLSPTRAMANIKDSVTDATVGRLQRFVYRTSGSGRGLLETARDHRWPVALLATAAVGLMVRALNNRNRRRPKPPRTLNEGGGGERRERTNPAARLRNRRMLATAASAGAACWAVMAIGGASAGAGRSNASGSAGRVDQC